MENVRAGDVAVPEDRVGSFVLSGLDGFHPRVLGVSAQRHESCGRVMPTSTLLADQPSEAGCR